MGQDVIDWKKGTAAAPPTLILSCLKMAGAGVKPKSL